MKNEYTVTQELYLQWVRDAQRRGARRVFHILWLVLAAANFCAFFFFWIKAGFSVNIVLFLLMFLFSLYCALLRPLVLGRRQYAFLAKTYGQDTWTRTISFGEEGLTITDHTSTMLYPYKDVEKILEEVDPIRLVLRNQTSVRLYRSGFADGTWDECKALLLRHWQGA